MDVNQQAELAVLIQAQSFLDLHADALEAINRAPARAELDEIVRSITARAALQDEVVALAASQTIRRNELHAELRHEIGRFLAVVRARKEAMPDVQALKPPSRRANDEAILSETRAVATAAVRHRERLERERLGGDFSERLMDLVRAYEGNRTDRNNSRSSRTVATKGIENDLRRGWDMIALLAALFEPENAEHQRLRAVWKAETVHAARALPKPAEAPRLEAGKDAPMLALPAGDAPAPGTELVTVADQPVLPASVRRGLLRLIGRLFGSDRAA